MPTAIRSHSGIHSGSVTETVNALTKIRSFFRDADIKVFLPELKSDARPQDMILHNPHVVARVMKEGLVGLGDAYVDGWWDCGAIDQFFDEALCADLPAKFAKHPAVVYDWLGQKFSNRQNRPRARTNVERHYNLGNDVFEATLDPYMQYSCGYWSRAKNLDEAQRYKLDLICKKLKLTPGMRLLDIGSGWGGLAKFAAEKYGVEVVGVTLSTEQKKFAEDFCKVLPVEFRLKDYREMNEQFDRVVSVGMFEHVGPKNYATYMNVVHRCLKPEGIALLHFFGTRDPFPNCTHSEVMWIDKHIFPGLVVPSMGRVGRAIDNLFVLEDCHNIGANHDPTLMAWAENFKRNWPTIAPDYDERFYRMWMYYLLSCAGAFRAREYQLWQLVLSPHGIPGGYTRPSDAELTI